jgi:uncharacterized membrane-anchored protein
MVRQIRGWVLGAVLAAFGIGNSPVQAQGAASPQAQQLEAAFAAAVKVAVAGPETVKVVEQADLKLPEGYVFVPRPEADQLLRAMGNTTDDRLVGLVFPRDDSQWMAVVKYEKSGYIRDDDAKNWNVDELFESLKTGTEEANKDRRSRGFPELEIVGWAERPRYDAATHRLVWSMAARSKGGPADAPNGVNYNTYALGREGFVSLNLLSDIKTVEREKVHAQTLLAALEFHDGKKYSDFNASTDRMAEYGLAALVGGVAAKKLGFFALAAAFLAKFAKLIGIAAIAAGAGLVKFFRRDKNPSA